jgi:malate dehydrogenase (oxaloacetate-decarboxylating)
MLEYTTHLDLNTGHEWIETVLTGKSLLSAPLLNKGTAFTEEERRELCLLGKLPNRIETLEEQVERALHQYKRYSSSLQKFIYLNNLHDKNQVLFYKLLSGHLKELLPMIYTPGVGSAVKEFSREFRQPRGLYIDFLHQDKMREIIRNRTQKGVDLIVVTDGEGVLGIGDQGIGGMDIPIAKLMVYCLCGIEPYKTLPIMLDVGTDNPQLLQDDMYLGWRHKRVRGESYDAFISEFITVIKEEFPKSFLHWEDFGRSNARRILENYQDQHCMFNDDMQGTGVVTLAALLAAVHASKIPLENQRAIVFGAGTAGVGIADQLCQSMVRDGIPEDVARKQIWLIDRQGVVVHGSSDIATFQLPYARSDDEKHMWPEHERDLLSVVKKIKPTILVGCSTVRGAFTEEVVKTMASQVAQPVIFPLSNPNENCEQTPENILKWTEGRALIATGSPFEAVSYQGKEIKIAQCNNALAFPGIGLGVLAVKATSLTDNMLWAAAEAISRQSPVRKDVLQPLLPRVEDIPTLAKQVAIKVAKQAIEDKVASVVPSGSVEDLIQSHIWKPVYRPIKLNTNHD